MQGESVPIPRPPVVAVMGHIDHGKSTLLDYIRRTNTTDREAGGITQRISAYECTYTMPDGSDRKITFLDTPGHEAFAKIRTRGADVADIAILVVSAEDGVKPQTLDALKAIRSSNTPFIVAINKIDRPNADVLRTKMSLAENEVYVEGYGGDVTAVPISAKTGEGISELLEMIILTSDVLEQMSDLGKLAEGIIIEANTDKNGVTATVIIKDGTLNTGEYIVCNNAYAPVRFIEDYKGSKLSSATFSTPVRITGWSEIPQVGDICVSVKSRKEAIEKVEANLEKSQSKQHIKQSNVSKSETLVPIIIKADTQGSIDAIRHEIAKVDSDRIAVKVVHAEIGEVRESDIKLSTTTPGIVIVKFNVGIDKQADIMRERVGTEVASFSIIYELSDYLKDLLAKRTPKKLVEENTGVLKVLKQFSKVKDKQVMGGRVESGSIVLGSKVKIVRRENEIGYGEIRELQSQKAKTSTVNEGNECGLMVESKIEIVPGDQLHAYIKVEK